MYFSRQNMLLERLPDDEPLPSLCEDEDFLRLLKRHCALPADEAFTQADPQLSLYADAAEKFIDLHSNTSYRPRTFRLNLTPSLYPSEGMVAAGGGFSTVRLPFGPISEALEVTYKDDEGDTQILEEGVDFSFVAGNSLFPEIIFLKDVPWPSLTKFPYPYQVTFTTSANQSNFIQKLTILMLAAYYYVNPSAMGVDIPQVGAELWSMINSLKVSFL